MLVATVVVLAMKGGAVWGLAIAGGVAPAPESLHAPRQAASPAAPPHLGEAQGPLPRAHSAVPTATAPAPAAGRPALHAARRCLQSGARWQAALQQQRPTASSRQLAQRSLHGFFRWLLRGVRCAGSVRRHRCH